MSSKKDIIVFDLDDTLYQELEFVKSGFSFVAKKLEGENSLTLYCWMLSRFRNNLDVFDHLSQEYAVSVDQLLNWYRYHNPKISISQSTKALLEYLNERNYLLAVITDGRSKTQRNKLKSLGIDRYFCKILISEEVGASKPSSVAYKLIEEEFPNMTYWYIGDNTSKDFTYPIANNWNSILKLDNGTNIHTNSFKYLEVLKELNLIVSELDELIKYF
ncbi:putative hydrolase of the HAD superfamily [Lishizhenia tianjinensis]|uniref:Putative hydrolase of the HAD superfamily n=1 Tax=Lishizhenia tianjinensis TaxID=477690 RepID=A0A1I6ZK48_9FLAO|nr:HAD family hydrolase [Lishizhenia tianjinensis]SFT63048.1 putative hydrolase of the HAD superfamily [Lishizhenia tianjinensis]